MPVQPTSSSYAFKDFSSKPNDILWIVSNCATNSLRSAYVANMKRTTKLKIDIFGKCGSEKLTRDPEAMIEIFATYKFYLSFENSLCRGYITEKFFKIMEAPIIPVVRGAFLG